ncbi:hypothetical protein [Ureibacillus sinduriensis]|uniref:BioF2-like acetyltransferase domain-containing protein n=1 Tax=Ureibacillus sinduriensis BLB-1 = JCM 15800 TaxID=1384057 RepID=A0A0A3HV68_9BACL|nr:hypothetical protein [Ureibacillus sinduriensis]KGR75130.1 hypothetical protein CD33_12705 [Ureibacillus sinduriensis BLB-1 = JCM 15800]
MLKIKRKLFILPVEQVYFQESKCDNRYEPKLINYIHVVKPSRKLQGKKTLHINLSEEERTPINRMSEQLKILLDKVKEEKWDISRSTHPTDQEIEEFQQFYNLNAKQNDIRKMNNFDVETLKLLRDQGGLVLTKLENEQKRPICFRIYVVGQNMVMALYNDGQDPQCNTKSENANHLLCWENMKYFGEQGYLIYDFGDATHLRELQEKFGGKVVTVFSGCITKSLFSQFLLHLNLKGMKKRLSF